MNWIELGHPTLLRHTTHIYMYIHNIYLYIYYIYSYAIERCKGPPFGSQSPGVSVLFPQRSHAPSMRVAVPLQASHSVAVDVSKSQESHLSKPPESHKDTSLHPTQMPPRTAFHTFAHTVAGRLLLLYVHVTPAAPRRTRSPAWPR